MAAFCHFWRMTPAEYRSLSLSDYAAMERYRARYLQKIKDSRPRRK